MDGEGFWTILNIKGIHIPIGSSGYHRFFAEAASLQAESEMEGPQNGLEDRVSWSGLDFEPRSPKATLSTDLTD